MSDDNDNKEENNCCKHCPDESENNSTPPGGVAFILTIITCIFLAFGYNYDMGMPSIQNIIGVPVIIWLIWTVILSKK